ncbi:hypothetical protein [Enterococcus faecalis]|uniref:hypothetical protein n=1 Tax=Enterococcus faecalis TaxID=1351 RepID=UPI001F587050|nr:hypothetical protein [Enterococcus faecalis]
MKKFMFVILLGVLFVFSACGNGNKADKDTQEDFSFLIYRNKEANRYIMKVYVPFEDTPSDLNYYYSYDENKVLNRTNYESDFQELRSSGNYELVYKSGRFKK